MTPLELILSEIPKFYQRVGGRGDSLSLEPFSLAAAASAFARPASRGSHACHFQKVRLRRTKFVMYIKEVL
jgi:hypothetical protein